MKVENIAAVLVTAELPPYAHSGTRLDVTASSIGDARSLQGGVLLPTALRGPNGEVVATAQGALSIGGFGGGSGGNSVQVNHLTVGRVPSGALVQVEVGQGAAAGDAIALSLKDPDFVSADRIAQAVNRELGDGIGARGGLGDRCRSRAADLPRVGSGAHRPARAAPVDVDAVARVVINERTGTVVVGGAVRLGPGGRRARQSVGEDFDAARSVAAGAVLANRRHDGRAAAGQVDVNEGPQSAADARAGHDARSGRSRAERARRDPARHHRDHAGAQGRRRAARGAGDSL